MKITKRQIRNLIREALIRESEDDRDDGGMYAAWARRQIENPHPHDKETWDEERRRLGKKTPADTSPEVLKLKDKVLEFIKGSNLGSAKQVEGANRWSVQPTQGVEVDFLIQSKASGIKLKVSISAISDYLPQGSFDGEDASFLADNLVKMSEILKKLGESELPIYDIGFSTRH